MTTHAGRWPASRTSATADAPVGKGTAAARAARSAFRPRRIVTSLIAAVILTAAGTITAIEVVSGVAGHPAKLVPYTRVAHWMQNTPWTHWGVLAISAALVLVGLWFLLAGLIPGRPRVVPLRGEDRDLAMALTRGGLRNTLAAAAEDVPDASHAQVSLGRHKVKVYVRCPSHLADAVSEQVRRSVEGRLDEIRPLTKYKVAVKPLTGKG
ncbi:DUF6286 domain-containing protein [Spirillospora sp. NPDC049652]